LFLKVGWLVQNLTESVCPPLEDPLPYSLKYREGPGEPLAVSVDADNDKLGFRVLILRRTVLNKVTLLQVCNLKLKLNLRPIVFGDVRLNLATHRTLNFDQNSIFSHTIGRCTQPGVVPVLHEANLMGLSVVFLVIQVPN
jgi:hypothetical protein